MLPLSDMQNAIKSIGSTLDSKSYDSLFRIIRPSPDGKYSYMDLLTILFGQFAAQQLGRSTIMELEQSTKTSKVSFKPPTECKPSKTARLGEIGKMLLKTGQNYEEQLLKDSGDVNRVKPVINETLIKQSLGALGVKLN